MRFLAAALVISLFPVSLATAERIPLDAAELKGESTHIVLGKIKATYSREVETTRYGKGTLETRYVLEIEVEKVEKGEGVKAKDIIYARGWRLKKYGADGPTPGPSGHRFSAAEATRVRAYLARGAYGATGQEDNGLAIVYPNGIESLAKAKK
jgi:hypothetical protein